MIIKKKLKKLHYYNNQTELSFEKYLNLAII